MVDLVGVRVPRPWLVRERVDEGYAAEPSPRVGLPSVDPARALQRENAALASMPRLASLLANSRMVLDNAHVQRSEFPVPQRVLRNVKDAQSWTPDRSENLQVVRVDVEALSAFHASFGAGSQVYDWEYYSRMRGEVSSGVWGRAGGQDERAVLEKALGEVDAVLDALWTRLDLCQYGSVVVGALDPVGLGENGCYGVDCAGATLTPLLVWTPGPGGGPGGSAGSFGMGWKRAAEASVEGGVGWEASTGCRVHCGPLASGDVLSLLEEDPEMALGGVGKGVVMVEDGVMRTVTMEWMLDSSSSSSSSVEGGDSVLCATRVLVPCGWNVVAPPESWLANHLVSRDALMVGIASLQSQLGYHVGIGSKELMLASFARIQSSMQAVQAHHHGVDGDGREGEREAVVWMPSGGASGAGILQRLLLEHPLIAPLQSDPSDMGRPFSSAGDDDDDEVSMMGDGRVRLDRFVPTPESVEALFGGGGATSRARSFVMERKIVFAVRHPARRAVSMYYRLNKGLRDPRSKRASRVGYFPHGPLAEIDLQMGAYRACVAETEADLGLEEPLDVGATRSLSAAVFARCHRGYEDEIGRDVGVMQVLLGSMTADTLVALQAQGSVHVVFMEELNTRTGSELRDVYAFLGLPHPKDASGPGYPGSTADPYEYSSLTMGQSRSYTQFLHVEFGSILQFWMAEPVLRLATLLHPRPLPWSVSEIPSSVLDQSVASEYTPHHAWSLLQEKRFQTL